MKMDFKSSLVIFISIVSLVRSQTLHFNRDVDPVEYLRRYGYLRDQHYTSQIPPNEAELKEALKTCQNFLKLSVTGSVNEETQAAMNRPRCGCSDVFSILMNHTFNTRNGWRGRDLTWRLLGSTRNSPIPLSVVRSEIIRAFALWSEQTPLKFREVNQSADIEIDFRTGAHGDGNSFDGPSGVLAHAYFPEVGTIHFDDREQWTTNSTTGRGIDLFIVAAHQFGHALGLDHSNVRDALMFPTYPGFIPNFRLSADEISAIRSIYGGQPPRPTTSSPRPTTTSPRPTTTTPTRLPPIFVRPDRRPWQCRRLYHAAFKDDNGILRMIRVDKLYQIPVYDPATGDLNDLRKSTRVFPGIVKAPDAAFHVPGSTYVIKGKKMQQFSRGTKLSTIVLTGFRVNSKITAAVALDKKNVFFFGTCTGYPVVWEYDLIRRKVISTKLMRSAFPGIPTNVDMALSRDPSEIIFVSGPEYYRYDVESKNCDGPYDFHPAFVGGGKEICGRAEI